VSCLWLMLSLPVITWARFLIWLDLGVLIYWFYGRRHSPLADRQEQRRTSGAAAFGDFITMLGGLTLFNGIAVTLLAYMTEFGITTEVTAKWGEIGLTPEGADVVALQVVAAGAILLVIGRVIARKGASPATT